MICTVANGCNKEKSAYFFLTKNIETTPKISATNKDITVLKNTICVMLLKKYAIGAASSLILIPGIAKQINKYVAIKAIRNNTTDTSFVFI